MAAGLGQIFVTFMKIGGLTIGGGYAMIPLMERELVDRRGWADVAGFLDTVALAQAMPGVFAVNMATQVGYRLRGVAGAVAATLGNVAAPIAAILLLALFFREYGGNETVERVFKGVRPAVVALIAAPALNLARRSGVGWRQAWVPAAAAALIWLAGVSPIAVIAAAAGGGAAWGWAEGRRARKREPRPAEGNTGAAQAARTDAAAAGAGPDSENRPSVAQGGEDIGAGAATAVNNGQQNKEGRT